jgi:hypothetical protein
LNNADFVKRGPENGVEGRPGSFVAEELQQVHSDLLYAASTKAGGVGYGVNTRDDNT